jgi:hypothetical protein
MRKINCLQLGLIEAYTLSYVMLFYYIRKQLTSTFFFQFFSKLISLSINYRILHIANMDKIKYRT